MVQMIKYRLFFAIPLLLLACGGKEENKLAAVAPPSSTVEVVAIEPTEVVREISIPGTIIPNEEVQLFSEVSGRVRSVHFKEGEIVQKGALLLQVDTDILSAQKQQYLVQLDLAEKDQARKQSLLSAKGISEEEYEKSVSTLAGVKAQIELINVQISKASLRAPFTGRIGLRRISEGAVISSSTLISTLVQENPIKVEFSVSERYASSVKPGQSVEFNLERDPKKYIAKVYAYEPLIDVDTRMITIRATLNNNGKLMSGAFVSVKYDLGNEVNAFMVPAESVIPILKGQKILVVRDGKVAEIPVEIGIRTADKVQVIGDIKPNEHVLVSGLLAFREGMPVNTKLVKR